MKIAIQSFSLLFLSAILVLGSCNKNNDNNNALPAPADSVDNKRQLSNMFAGLRTVPQTFEVNAGSYQVIKGAKRTKLTFYPNSFRDKNGNTITNGPVTIKMIEIYRPGEMIANRSSAIASGRLLISRGQAYIKAYRAGIEVYPTTYGIGFWQPGDDPQPMDLFYGSTANPDSTVTWTQAPANSGTRQRGTTLDTTGGQQNFYYQFDSCTRFNWINCDYFYNAVSPLTNVSMIMKDSAMNQFTTQVFMVCPAINSVTFLQQYDSAAHAFSFSPGYLIPINMNVHVVSLSMRNGKYFYSEIKNLMTRKDLVDTLRPQEKSISDVLTALGGL